MTPSTDGLTAAVLCEAGPSCSSFHPEDFTQATTYAVHRRRSPLTQGDLEQARAEHGKLAILALESVTVFLVALGTVHTQRLRMHHNSVAGL